MKSTTSSRPRSGRPRIAAVRASRVIGQSVIGRGERVRALEQRRMVTRTHAGCDGAKQLAWVLHQFVEDGSAGIGELQDGGTPIVRSHSPTDQPEVGESVTEPAGAAGHQLERLA